MKYMLFALLLFCSTARAGDIVFDSCAKMARIADRAHEQMWAGKSDEQIALSIPKTFYPVQNTSVRDKDGLIKFIAYVRHHFYFEERHDTVFAIQMECFAALQ